MTNNECFKILIASDVHLGHGELHSVCGQDSFRAFEEVLQAAKKHDVDFILLAGDLFDKNKPSFYTIDRAFQLIRENCLGEYDERSFEILMGDVNLNDEKFKVKYPIFTIHGNHDDPTGVTQMSIVDVFHSSGMVNYFGKRDNVEEIRLSPIILAKGRTKIALYGLGAIHEERLQHLISKGKFNYLVPDEDGIKLFNLLVVHQNRVPRPNTSYLHPADLQTLPNLVIWGHEHDCVDLQHIEDNDFYIYQPGSTVATSLCDGEAGSKYYAILEVDYDTKKEKPRFRLTKHELQTVRPFVIKTISVDDDILPSLPSRAKTQEAVQKYILQYCKNEIEDLIMEAKHNSNGLAPLIRLRVQYTEPEHNVNTAPLCNQFRTKGVAKYEGLIRFIKKNSSMSKYSNVVDVGDNDFDFEEMASLLNRTSIDKAMGLEGIVTDYFNKVSNKDQKLGMFAEEYLTKKVQDFVQKGNTDALDGLFDNYKNVILNNIDFDQFDSDDPEKEIKSVCRKLVKDRDLLDQIGTSKGTKLRKIKADLSGLISEDESNTDADDDDGDNDDCSEDMESQEKTKKREIVEIDDDGSDNMESQEKTKKRKPTLTVKREIIEIDDDDSDDELQKKALLKRKRKKVDMF